MKKNNKGSVGEVILRFFLYLLIAAASIYLIIVGVGLVKTKLSDRKLETAHSVEEIADIITAELDKGGVDSVSMFVDRVPESDLKKINEYIPTMCGSVDTYRSSGNTETRKAKVTFSIKKNTTTHVYDYIKHGTAIPEDDKEALVLYNKIVEIAESCTKGGMTDYMKELRLHDYLLSNCVYGLGSPEDENEFRAYGAIVDGVAVCSGYAEAMALLLTYVGIDCKVVVGTSKNENHAWNLVKINANWYHLDPTWDDPVELNIITHAYFNISDEEIAYDHSWNKDRTEKASSTDQSYFKISSKICDSIDDFEISVQTQMFGTDKYVETAVSGGDPASYVSRYVNDYHYSSMKYTLIDRKNYTVIILYK
ncbi:MAG: hypothetical protein IJJ74_03445 [Eubacterium sp.]|nr:hypothetical protein [Eubacterium sp.]